MEATGHIEHLTSIEEVADVLKGCFAAAAKRFQEEPPLTVPMPFDSTRGGFSYIDIPGNKGLFVQRDPLINSLQYIDIHGKIGQTAVDEVLSILLHGRRPIPLSAGGDRQLYIVNFHYTGTDQEAPGLQLSKIEFDPRKAIQDIIVLFDRESAKPDCKNQDDLARLKDYFNHLKGTQRLPFYWKNRTSNV